MVKTKALVLSHLKYGDTSLIVRCFTEELGLQSYLLRGVLSSKKNKKAAYFQPLSILDVVTKPNKNGGLSSIKEVSSSYTYHSVYQNIYKQAIVLFLSEVLSMTIKETEANTDLFAFIEASLIWLDTHDDSANFHLVFLAKLSRYLGIQPDFREDNGMFFDMIQGVMVSNPSKGKYLSGKQLEIMKVFFNASYLSIVEEGYSSQQRQLFLGLLIQYFDLHLDTFRKINSLDILKSVFNYD